MKNNIRTIRYTKSLLFILISIFAGPYAYASTIFNWTMDGSGNIYTEEGDIYVTGQFESNMDIGTITENDITSFTYNVYQNDALLFNIDLINGLVNGSSDGIIANYFDFEYLIGSSSFQQTNSDVTDPNFPVDFTLEDTNGDFYGLYYMVSFESWGIDYGNSYPAEIPYFNSGPVISTVPVPASFWLFFSGLLSLFGVNLSRKKR